MSLNLLVIIVRCFRLIQLAKCNLSAIMYNIIQLSRRRRLNFAFIFLRLLATLIIIGPNLISRSVFIWFEFRRLVDEHSIIYGLFGRAISGISNYTAATSWKSGILRRLTNLLYTHVLKIHLNHDNETSNFEGE